MVHALILLGFILSDGRPDGNDRASLPSRECCQRQVQAADAWVKELEWHKAISPSRAHLLAHELAVARQYREWWSQAHTTVCEPFMDGDRDRMHCLKAQLGPVGWWTRDWPFLLPP